MPHTYETLFGFHVGLHSAPRQEPVQTNPKNCSNQSTLCTPQILKTKIFHTTHHNNSNDNKSQIINSSENSQTISSQPKFHNFILQIKKKTNSKKQVQATQEHQRSQLSHLVEIGSGLRGSEQEESRKPKNQQRYN